MNYIITGGSRGIGKAIALYLTKEGHQVIITYRSDEAGAKQTREETRLIGKEAIIIKADTGSEEDCKRVAKEAMTLGSIEGLVNNAGITKDGLAMRMKEDQFNMVLQTNLVGPFLMTKAILPTLIKQRRGSIVNLSSVAGLYGNIGQVNYSSSKAGVIGMTKALAKELGNRNIRVNAVAPGFIETAMTDGLSDEMKEMVINQISLHRLGKPEDVASVVSFLLSEKAGYITGQVIEISGGMII